MNILHFTAVGRNVYSGIYIAVPQHIKEQQKKECVAVVNIYNIQLDGIHNQFEYTTKFSLGQLPKPFSTPDIVIFHGIYIPQYITIYRELVKLNVPYVIIPHGSLTQAAQNKKKIKKIIGNTILFNAFIKHSDAIQYLSNNEALSSKYKQNYFVSGNGVSIPNDKKQTFSEYGTRLVYIGRLEWHIKGLDLLIQAISMKKNILLKNNCGIYIYGPNQKGQYEYIEKMIKNFNVDELVHLSHEVFGDEKEQILLNTDVFIQTSRTEGLPMGILEALSYGVPCFVTRGTGLGKLIEQYNAGWFAENDVESIADMLEQVVNGENNWSEMSRNAKQLIEKNFVWSKVAEDAICQYKQIVGSREG